MKKLVFFQLIYYSKYLFNFNLFYLGTEAQDSEAGERTGEQDESRKRGR